MCTHVYWFVLVCTTNANIMSWLQGAFSLRKHCASIPKAVESTTLCKWLVALVLVCVLFGALWLLWCLPVYYLMYSDCSGVCLCTIWCTLVALVLACVIQAHVLNATNTKSCKCAQLWIRCKAQVACVRCRAQCWCLRCENEQHTQEQIWCELICTHLDSCVLVVY
jgi:hypothetical protein